MTIDHRRHAIQVVAGLPEDRADSLAILDFARALIVGFVHQDDATEFAPKATVLAIVRSSADL